MGAYLKKIFKFLLFLFTGWFIVIGIFRVFLYFKLARVTPSKRLYVKYIPFYLDKYKIRKLRMFSQGIGGILSVAIIAYILLQNFSPFQETMIFVQDNNSDKISPLTPKDRVQPIILGGQIAYRQSGDLTYFKVKMPFNFNRATVRVSFKSPYPDQDVYIGFQDRSDWHYHTKLIDSPLLDGITWDRVSDGLTLYQRNKKFSSIKEFLNNPPQDSLIGIVGLENTPIDPYINDIPDYRPSSTGTLITTPIRGKHTLLVYLKNEPFKMTIIKQDLNWYQGSDPLTIDIYKGNQVVMNAIISDDGISEAIRKAGKEQTITLQNPGPGFPESGVYKVVLSASGDTIIKRIQTNLQKVVFENSIYPVANKEVYHIDGTASQSATQIVSNALLLNLRTFHKDGLQTIKVGTISAVLNNFDYPVSLIPPESLTYITLPKSDVMINGVLGYFAFKEENFFNPLRLLFYPISSTEQLEAVDYVLSDYNPPQIYNDWRMTETSFDLSTAYIENNELSWIISAPGLKSTNRKLLIKDLTVELDKKSTDVLKRIIPFNI